MIKQVNIILHSENKEAEASIDNALKKLHELGYISSYKLSGLKGVWMTAIKEPTKKRSSLFDDMLSLDSTFPKGLEATFVERLRGMAGSCTASINETIQTGKDYIRLSFYTGDIYDTLRSFAINEGGNAKQKLFNYTQ